jgi:hypothetical protein
MPAGGCIGLRWGPLSPSATQEGIAHLRRAIAQTIREAIRQQEYAAGLWGSNRSPWCAKH